MSNAIKKILARGYLGAALQSLRFQLKDGASRSFAHVCIVAELSRNTGIAHGARLQQSSLLRAGIDTQLLDSTPGVRNPFYRIEHKPGTAYIFHSGGPEISSQIRTVMPHARDAYRIAYWAWELPVAPRSWPAAEGVVSEIWTCSEFARRGLSLRYSIPTYSVPHVIAPSTRDVQKGNDRFEVLAFGDTRSSLRRKNPAGALDAFTRAFGESPRARLTLKLNGRTEDAQIFIEKASRIPNVRVITEYLNEHELEDLFVKSHVLLSLHRAEGFGLPMMEAMSYGTPVIASKWSGNLDYMDEANSILVPCSLAKIGEDPVYSDYADALWAEPDIDSAAESLKQLATDRELYLRVSGNALRAVERWAADQHLPI